jgi:hypothetical protein
MLGFMGASAVVSTMPKTPGTQCNQKFWLTGHVRAHLSF